MKTYPLKELRLAQAKGCRIEILVDGVWMELKNPEFKEPDDVCRIHPADEWKARLPRLKEGAEWHRNDFTNEMLEGGYRPLLKGETARHGDNGRGFRDIEWLDVIGDGKIDCDPDYYFRTRRPVPPEFLHPDELAKQPEAAPENLCPCSFPHQPHDYCDGSPAHTRKSSQQVPDFGEPWALNALNVSLGDTGDYEGQIEILSRKRVVTRFYAPVDENENDFNRIIACVNALAGVSDPAEFVRQAKEMREAIMEAHNEMEASKMFSADLVNQIRSGRRVSHEAWLADAEVRKHNAAVSVSKLKPFLP